MAGVVVVNALAGVIPPADGIPCERKGSVPFLSIAEYICRAFAACCAFVLVTSPCGRLAVEPPPPRRHRCPPRPPAAVDTFLLLLYSVFTLPFFFLLPLTELVVLTGFGVSALRVVRSHLTFPDKINSMSLRASQPAVHKFR